MDKTKIALLNLAGAKEEETQPNPAPTGKRLDDLETTTEDIILMMADLIGGDEK